MADKIKPVFLLGIVCLISAYLLGKVYLLTQEKVEKEKERATQSALMMVLPNAVNFEKVEENLWLGWDENHEKVGLVFHTSPRGYGGPIGIICGLSLNGKIMGIRIAEPTEGFKETPGLGSKIRESKFLSQFLGKGKERLRLKVEGGEIDAITAATISSRAVCEGIREGIIRYEKYLRKLEEDND